jgi:hypothetical protein
MRMRSLASLSAVCLVVSLLTLVNARAAGAAEIITFEEMTPGGPGTGGAVPVLNFYASRGVIFRAVALDYSKGVPVPNFTHSGTKGIETCYATEFCSVPVEMTFTQAQARVKAFVGFDGPLVESLTITMRGFNANGQQVAVVTKILPARTTPTPTQTPMEITTPNARIVRVTVGPELNGQATFSSGFAMDDVEFDTVGPPPQCPATVNPTVTISQPGIGSTVQFNQFVLGFTVHSQDPFATTTVTDTGSGGQSNKATFPGFNGVFGPTAMNGLLVPGFSVLTVAVKDCKGSAQAAVNINFTPIASDEAFRVLGLEAVQAVQNVPSSVPMVADKPTVVRVYLKVTGSTPAVDNVRGTLFAYRPANSFQDVGLPLPGSVKSLNSIRVDNTDDLKGRRVTLNKSLNFDLPANWISEGAAHFEVKLDVDGAPSSPVNIPCIGCNNTLFNGTPIFSRFLATPTLRLRMVGLQYTFGTPATVAAPRAVDFSLFRSWVRRAYPAGRFVFTQSTVTSTHPWQFDCDDANAQLASIRASEVSAGRDPHTHYIALVSNTGGFMRGCAEGIPDDPDPTVVASSPTGSTTSGPKPTNTTGDTDASFGDWYAGHELAHEFGRMHPGFCNGNSDDDDDFPNPNGQISDNLQTHVGLDLGDPANGIARTIISPFAFDIMTYCNQPQWFSAYNYMAVLNRLRAENTSGAGVAPANTSAGGGGGQDSQAQPQPGDAMTGDFIHVVASVNLSKQTGSIRFIDRVTRATMPGASKNELATLRFRDKAGKVIGTYPAWVRESTDREKGEDRKGMVQAVIPLNRNAASLELLLEGKLLARRIITEHAPEVRQMRVATRQAPHTAGAIGETARVITWAGADRDGGVLTYLVQINGEDDTWDTIATGLKTNSITLTEEQLQGNTPRRLRVIANDGFNSSKPIVIEIPQAKEP